MPSPTSPALNQQTILELRELDTPQEPSIVDELAAIFFTTAPEHIALIREAATAGRLEPVQKAAHRLKSIGGNLGAEVFSDYCQTLESLQGADFGPQALQILELLDLELVRVVTELRRDMLKTDVTVQPDSMS